MSFSNGMVLITRRRIADQLEKRAGARPAAPPEGPQSPAPYAGAVSGAEDSTRTSTLARLPDPASLELDACWEEQWQKSLLQAATETVKAQVSPRQYQMFELYVLREWPVRKVADTLGVSTGQVYLAKHRVSRLLKLETRRLENDLR